MVAKKFYKMRLRCNKLDKLNKCGIIKAGSEIVALEYQRYGRNKNTIPILKAENTGVNLINLLMIRKSTGQFTSKPKKHLFTEAVLNLKICFGLIVQQVC